MKINFYNVGLKYRATVRKVIKKAISHLSQSSQIELSVSFLSEEEIKSLNNAQRNVDSVTDVLSFPYLQLQPFEKVSNQGDADRNPRTGDVLLGEIMICPLRAKQQAEEYGHSQRREIAFLALHGFLHLCGFDHVEQSQEEQMMATAESVLKSLKITR